MKGCNFNERTCINFTMRDTYIGGTTMSTKKVSSTNLTKDEKEAVKARYKETTSLSQYVMELTQNKPEINLVEVMKHLPQFVDSLSPIESTVFKMYYLQELSISQITGMEFIDRCMTTEKVLKSTDKKFREWLRNFYL